MKKLFTLLALTAICFTAWRCSDKEYNDIALDMNRLYIYPGMSYSVGVSGGSGEYTVELRNSELTDFVDVSITPSYGGSERVLTVETSEGEEGVATIVVTDTKSGKTTECFLVVNSKNFGSGWGIDKQQHFVYAGRHAEEIETDLQNKLFPEGSSLHFNPSPDPSNNCYGAGHWYVLKTNELNVVVDTLASGTFASMPLGPEIAEAYDVLPMEERIHSSVRYVFEQEDGQHVYDLFYVYSPGRGDGAVGRIMYEDRTAYYQAKYPNSNATVVNRYFDSWGH